MASAHFELQKHNLLRLVDFIAIKKFRFISGEMHKNPDNVFRECIFKTPDDFSLGNNKMYLLPLFAPCENLAVSSVQNIHIGQIHAINPVFGGPYVEMYFFIKKDCGRVSGDVTLKPVFHLHDYSEVKPSEPLKAAFKDIRSFIRSRMREQQVR